MVDMPVRSGEGCGPGAAEPGPAPKSRRRRANGTASSALVGAGGFEPPKSSTTDLQSAPFGHSGTLPYAIVTAAVSERGGAGRRTRTPDLLITNQLLYQLSYTSTISDESYDSRLSLICQPKNLFLEEFFLHTVHKRHRDLQRSAPAAECALCGGGLYPGETCWRIWGRVLCGECAGPWLLDGLTFCRVRLREVRK